MQIAVIGGGVTGLVAARELANKGHTITIYERNAHIGGLAAGFPFKGTHLEHAYHHVFRTDHDLIQLVQELGIRNRLQWFRSSVAMVVRGRLYPFASAVDVLRFTPIALISRLRLGAVLFWLQHRKRWNSLTPIPACIWMSRWCGKQAYQAVWEPLLRGKFHAYYRDVSMAWLWARIHTRANSRKREAEKLGYFEGGFAVLINALEQALEDHGVRIRTNMPVTALWASETGKSVMVQTEGGIEQFDRVLCTVPSPVFAQYIEKAPGVPPAYRNQLNNIRYLNAICVVFSSTQSLSPYYWVNIADRDMPFVAFVQHTNLLPAAWYQGEHVYYAGTYVPKNHALLSLQDAEIKETFLHAVARIFPDFDPQSVTETH
ncbi:FAD-dependent oxidoreductase, partial [Candidatus Peribacteria bacterium]|nr:FAD-dependent oxidoreductase [Candidatus Peribacteria bacterium]